MSASLNFYSLLYNYKKIDNKTEEAKWDWIPCNYNLKREISGKTVFWNLSPSIILTNPSGSVKFNSAFLYKIKGTRT